MNQNNQNKINCSETWAKFETGMDFYIPVGVILVELDSSNYMMEITTGSQVSDETGSDSGNSILQPCESVKTHEPSSGSRGR